MMKLLLIAIAIFPTTFASASATASTLSTSAVDSLQLGEKTLHSMGGCYLVDFSYAETQALKAGYTLDGRVYDVNRTQSFKEWIYIEDLSPTRLRLQHILFATDLNGVLRDGSQLKHTGEDWEFQAPFLYDFTGPRHWAVKDIRSSNSGQWTRRITNLDDGLRHQCSAAFNAKTAYTEWSCANYAPIPGRETRDMGRHDYDTMDRQTRIVAYGNSWLERQDNVKTIDRDGQPRTPLAKEVGKNWYVRLPDAECQPARDFAKPRHEFWVVEREAWEQVLVGDSAFVEKTADPTLPSRYAQVLQLEDQTLSQSANLTDPLVRSGLINQIKSIIENFRLK